MKKNLKVKIHEGFGSSRIDISGLTNQELNELSSTEFKESVEMILSMVDEDTCKLLKESRIYNMIYAYPGTITITIDRRK